LALPSFFFMFDRTPPFCWLRVGPAWYSANNSFSPLNPIFHSGLSSPLSQARKKAILPPTVAGVASPLPLSRPGRPDERKSSSLEAIFFYLVFIFSCLFEIDLSSFVWVEIPAEPLSKMTVLGGLRLLASRGSCEIFTIVGVFRSPSNPLWSSVRLGIGIRLRVACIPSSFERWSVKPAQ